MFEDQSKAPSIAPPVTGDQISYPVVGARLNDLETDISSLQAQAQAGKENTLGQPEPGTPFIVAYRKHKKGKGVFATMKVRLPANTVSLRIVIQDVSQSADPDTMMDEDLDVEEGVTEKDFEFPRLLDFETTYGLVRLVAFQDGIGKNKNPPEMPAAGVYLTTFTTPEAFGVPSSPSLALLEINRLDPVTVDAYDVEIQRVVYAPLTDGGAAQSYGAAGVDWVHAVLKLDGEMVDPDPHILTAEELTQVADGLAGRPLSSPSGRGFVRIRNAGLTPARIYNWPKNIVHTQGETKSSTGPALQFIAGNLSQDPLNLTSLSLVFTQGGDNDPKHVAVDFLFTQPTTPVGLRWITLQKKFTGEPDSAYVTIKKKKSMQADEFNTPGAKTCRVTDSAKLKGSQSYVVRLIIEARGGSDASHQRILTQSFGTGANPDVTNDSDVPSGLNVPILQYIGKKDWLFQNLQASTNIHTLKDRQVAIGNGINFLDLPNYITSGRTVVVAVPLANAWFSVNAGHGHLDVRLADLRTLFGSAGSVQLVWRATNDIGNSTETPGSLFKSLATLQDIVNPNDAVTSIAAGTLPPGENYLPNAALNRESGGNILSWFSWDTATFPIGTGGGNLNFGTASTPIRYNRTGQSIIFIGAQTRWLNCNLKKGRVLRSDKATLGFWARANTALAGMTLRVYVRRDDLVGGVPFDQINNVATPGVNFIDIPLLGLDTTYREYGTLIQWRDDASIDDGANPVDQFLLFQLIGTLGANQVEFKNPRQGRGAFPLPFSLKPADDGLMDAVGTLPGTTPDVVNPVRSQGGWVTIPGNPKAIERWLEAV